MLSKLIFFILLTICIHIASVKILNRDSEMTQLGEKTFSIGESLESAEKKLRAANFEYIDIQPEEIFASKKKSSSILSYVELRVILKMENGRISKIWVKEFNHTI